MWSLQFAVFVFMHSKNVELCIVKMKTIHSVNPYTIRLIRNYV